MRVYQLSCCSFEWVGQAAFLSLSPVPCVSVWQGETHPDNRWITHPLLSSCSRPAWICESRTQQTETASFYCLKARDLRLSTAHCQSQTTVEEQWWRCHIRTAKTNTFPKEEYNGHFLLPWLPWWTVSSAFHASAFPVSELPSTIGLFWWQQVSQPQTKYKHAGSSGRERQTL